MAQSDDGRWLTYEELAKELGSTVQAARILAVRRKYPRRIPNSYGERTRVLVPEKIEAPRRRKRIVGDTSGGTEPDSTPDNQAHALIEQALGSLREQLNLANERADRAERQAEHERLLRLDAEERAAAARAEMDARRDWSLKRRLRWAFGRGR